MIYFQNLERDKKQSIITGTQYVCSLVGHTTHMIIQQISLAYYTHCAHYTFVEHTRPATCNT